MIRAKLPNRRPFRRGFRADASAFSACTPQALSTPKPHSSRVIRRARNRVPPRRGGPVFVARRLECIGIGRPGNPACRRKPQAVRKCISRSHRVPRHQLRMPDGDPTIGCGMRFQAFFARLQDAGYPVGRNRRTGYQLFCNQGTRQIDQIGGKPHTANHQQRHSNDGDCSRRPFSGRQLYHAQVQKKRSGTRMTSPG
jgi:hypothetical protein